MSRKKCARFLSIILTILLIINLVGFGFWLTSFATWKLGHEDKVKELILKECLR